MIENPPDSPQVPAAAADGSAVTSLLEALISQDSIENLTTMDLADIRQLRDRYQQVEDGLSFARRMVQGRLDIALSEVERRHSEGRSSAVDRLPDVLTRGFSSSDDVLLPRLVRDRELPEFTETISAELDRILGIRDLRDLQVLTDGSLGDAIANLHALEKDVSEHRRRSHNLIDTLQGEIIDRYRTGRASVDDLLAT